MDGYTDKADLADLANINLDVVTSLAQALPQERHVVTRCVQPLQAAPPLSRLHTHTLSSFACPAILKNHDRSAGQRHSQHPAARALCCYCCSAKSRFAGLEKILSTCRHGGLRARARRGQRPCPGYRRRPDAPTHPSMHTPQALPTSSRPASAADSDQVPTLHTIYKHHP